MNNLNSSLFPVVCFSCRKSWRKSKPSRGETHECPNCKGDTFLLHHNFSAPKKNDETSWALVYFLVQNGFEFSGWVKPKKCKNEPNKAMLRPGYPKDMIDARSFVDTWAPPEWDFFTKK